MMNYLYAYRILLMVIIINMCPVLFETESLAQSEKPYLWPWKGVTVFASASKPSDLIMLKKRLGLNSVRLEMNVRMIAGRDNLKPFDVWNTCIKWVDDMIDTCRVLGITSIISISEFPIDPGLNINQESPGFWNNPARIDDAISLIGDLGRHLRRCGKEFAAYEILSEPLLRDGNSVGIPPNWHEIQDRIIREIRRYDTKRILVINPAPGGSPKAYKAMQTVNDPNVIYGVHMYLPLLFTHQGMEPWTTRYTYPGVIRLTYWDKGALRDALSDVIEFQRINKTFIWVGEFSAIRWADGAENYLRDVVDIFNQNQWGWSYFAFGEFHGWNPDYDVFFSTNRPDDWKAHFKGQGSTRWQTLIKLFEMP